MKDKPNKKKVIFDDTDVRHARLKVRLEYDGLSQAEFFRSLITGYLENDKSVMEYITRYKESNKKLSKRNLKYQTKDAEIADDLLGQFGIGDEELENIFDVIASSNPDL
jgi:succinate dehydrogenase flavin-adding protein (antitoxin of CptAB toxin-antitoxin module)